MNTFFNQRSPQHPEVRVCQWPPQTDRQTDKQTVDNSMTDPAQGAESVKTPRNPRRVREKKKKKNYLKRVKTRQNREQTSLSINT